MPLQQKLNLSIPDIPGNKLENKLKEPILKFLCDKFKEPKPIFFGAQPVGFGKQHLESLLTKNYFVCEKTDGLRLLILTFIDRHKNPQTFLIDRKNDFYHLPNLFFIQSEGNRFRYQSFALIDGELVYQNHKDQARMVYLAFDLLACNGDTVIKDNFRSRQGKLRDWIIDPFNELMQKDEVLRNKVNPPFLIVAKKMELCYGLQKIIEEDMPTLPHNSDGLIFTSVNEPYVLGTCNGMLKWKPPNENSVDFKLKARKSGSVYRFGLFVWKGESNYEYYDDMKVTKEEYLTLFKSKIDTLTNGKGLIVEVVRSKDGKSWVFYRFREDKMHGNYYKIVDKIMQTIKDAVDSKTLINMCPQIRENWKTREKSSRPKLQ